MKSVLVTGSNGQLGTALRNISSSCEGFTFHFTDIDTLDICDKNKVDEFVKSNKIDYIINCAAYTAVDKAEDNLDDCLRINRDAVRNLGEAAASYGAKVIHVSTDYVFDGNGTKPYVEDDAPSPKSVYGSTKLAGERALQEVCKDYAIIRTAWLYSETGNNFVKTMLRLGTERGAVGVVADQHGTPTYAGDLAAAVKAVLTADDFTAGIYHYTDEGQCTWYDFAVKIFEFSGVACEVKALTTAEYPTKAARPAYSVLDKTKIKQAFGLQIPRWEDSLRKCIENILNKS